MSDAYQCPKCKGYILGRYCGTCKEDISKLMFHNFTNPFEGTPFEDIFKKFAEKKEDKNEFDL